MTLKKCIVFDIDGTLADLEHRRHHVSRGKKDWKAFFAGIPADKPIQQTIFLNKWFNQMNTLRDATGGRLPRMPIYLCSGRSELERKETEEWLFKYEVEYDKMFMRKAGDYRADHIIKRELLEEIRAEGYEPFIIFDDRQCVVDMWRKEGLFVLQCDPNPSHTDHHGFEFHERIKYPLTIMVGPSGSGKSTWIEDNNYTGNMVISSDIIRQELCGDFRDQSKNLQVFEAMHDIATNRLRRGLPVILDATHIRDADRVKAAKLVPSHIPVRYVVINRPLKDKIASAGWRSAVSVKGKPLVEFHDQVFKSNLKAILKGDGLPNVIVYTPKDALVDA